MEWLGPLLGGGLSAVLITRRGWWFLCVAAGWYQAAQLGQLIDDKEAFSRGRAHVVQTVLLAVTGALSRIDWPAISGGLAEARRQWRAHLAIAWRGVKRDFRRFGEWINSPIRKPAKATSEDYLLRIAAIADDPSHPQHEDYAVAKIETLKGMELERRVVARRITNGEANEGDHSLHEHIQQQLAAAYMADPVVARFVAAEMAPRPTQGLVGAQPLLGAVTGGFALNPYVIGAVTLFALGGYGLAWERGARLDHVKAENEILEANAGAYQRAIRERDAALADRDAALTKRTENYLNELDRANAETMKARQQAAREKKAKLDAQKATLSGGGDVPLADLLLAYPGGGDAPGGSGPASDSNP